MHSCCLLSLLSCLARKKQVNEIYIWFFVLLSILLYSCSCSCSCFHYFIGFYGIYEQLMNTGKCWLDIKIELSIEPSWLDLTGLSMQLIPCRMYILLIEKLFSTIGVILFHRNNIKLFGFMFFYSTVMHSIFYDLIMFFIILNISSSILIFNEIFHLISFLCIHPFFINCL